MLLAAVAALSFTIGGVFMKYADGIRNVSAAALFLALFAFGAVVQSHAMRGADLGATYIVVLGLEAAFAFGLGAVLFAEAVTATKVAAVLLIVAGIALLRAH